MPDLTLKSFGQIVADQAASAQAAAGRALDYSVGSVLRALAEAHAAVALWHQAETLKVLASNRLSTSTGTDADTFVADYGLTRVPATAARGEVVLSRAVPVAAAFVPVGALVRTADGAATYALAPGGAGYDLALGGYTLAASVPSITVPVAALAAGAAGNAGSGTVTLLASAIAGVDAVANPAALTGGAAGETDAALRARFRAFIASLSKATRAAIEFAVSGVQPGLSWAVIEGEDAAGAPKAAHFTVVVDDGSGAASSALVSAVMEAVEAVRPLGITYSVMPAKRVVADVSLSVAVEAGVDRNAVIGRVGDAIEAHIAFLGLGDTLALTRIAALAFGADPAVTNVTALRINGTAADLVPTRRQVVRAGTVAVG